MPRETILVVDDIEINRIILEEILNEEYNIVQKESGPAALEALFSGTVEPMLVLLDIMMPDMDGHEVLARMKANHMTRRIPVIFITAADAGTHETKGLMEGASDYISKPFYPSVVKARVDNQMRLRNYSEHLEAMVDAKVAEVVYTKERMLETMAAVIEYRNLESGRHVIRTRNLSKILINHLCANPDFHRSIPESDRELVVKAVPVHDIGKIGIPDEILLKPGKLTPEEFEIIKTHTVIGAEIIQSILEVDDSNYIIYCLEICRSHHERWDGKGYPDGLSGGNIPLSARILSVVDVYDALVSERVYKPPIPHAEAIKIIAECAGTQFDPEIVRALLEVEGAFAREK